MNRVAGRYLWGNERTENKGLDSIRYLFLLLVMEHRSDDFNVEQTPLIFYTGDSLFFCGTLKVVCLCRAWKWGFDWVSGRVGEWGSELSERMSRERRVGLWDYYLSLCRSLSTQCFLSLRGFTGIRGCPNNWKLRFYMLIYKFKGEWGWFSGWWSTCHRLQLDWHGRTWRSKRQSL